MAGKIAACGGSEGTCNLPITPSVLEGAVHGAAENFCSSAAINSRVAREFSGIWTSRIPSAARACRALLGETVGLPQQPR